MRKLNDLIGHFFALKCAFLAQPLLQTPANSIDSAWITAGTGFADL
jgi:hypothetical protein